MRHTKRFLILSAVAALAAGLIFACSSDSPSEPRNQPPPPPGGGGGGTGGAFSVVVTVTPPEITAGGDTPSEVLIQVRRADNNALPPNGSTVTVTTSLGSFGSAGSSLQQTTASLFNGEARVLLFPGDQVGTAVVQARFDSTLGAAIGQATVQIREAATFFLSFVEPDVGNPQGGEEVLIHGGGFENPVRVTFGGVPAQVLSVTGNRIRVRTPRAQGEVPPGTSQPVTVAVTINLNEQGQQSDSLASGFTYVRGGGNIQQPVIFSITPRTGPNEGGTRVTINGEGFQAPVQVLFGAGSSASNFTGVEGAIESVTPNQIVVVTPPASAFGQNNQNSTVDVLLRNLNSGFSTVATAAFQYGAQIIITAISPGEGPFSGGTRVTIFGQGFDEPVAVTFGGRAVDVLSVTGTEILVRTVPIEVTECEDVTGEVRVVNVETGNSGTGPDFLFDVPNLVITGVTPGSGPEAGGTTVTITGLNFTEPLRVLFGEQAGSVLSVAPDGTSLTVRSPAFTGQFASEPCDDNADGQQGERFVATSVTIDVENLLTGCDDTFSNSFTYIPSDQSCRGDVAPPPPPPPPAAPECNDGIDNDGDGFSDHGSVNPVNPDPECTGPNDDDEST